MPGINWSKTQVDNTVRVRNGYGARLAIQGGHQAVISDTSFIQLRGYSKWIHSLSWGARVLGRAELRITAVSDFSRLPTSYRFYADGDHRVRGYSDKELGPKNAKGNVIGGRYLAAVSAEYEQAVTGNWDVAVFVDAGNAFNSSTIDPEIGAGIGLRWYSRLGLIRLGFALPLHQSNDPFQVHFSMGPEL